MIVSSLKLHAFRNLDTSADIREIGAVDTGACTDTGTYGDTRTNNAKPNIEFSPRLNFIIGANGQGKTNLIEALALLGHGKSFRTSNLSELVRWGEKQASVYATVADKLGESELGVVISHGKRQLFLNGTAVKSMIDFIGRLSCVIFSPTDLALVKAGPGERRRFIDRHLVDVEPGVLNNFLEYQRALKSKHALLKQDNLSPDKLAPWNLILARSGILIHQARKRFLEALVNEVRKLYSCITTADGELDLTLESTWNVEGLSIEHIVRQLENQFEREARFKQSHFGPHRDDVRIDLNSKDTRAFASQGQTRSVVLALKLAVIRLIERVRGEPPVLLLDDVDSELDASRGKNLFEFVLAEERQVFVTGTDMRYAELIPETEIRRFSINSNEIRQVA